MPYAASASCCPHPPAASIAAVKAVRIHAYGGREVLTLEEAPRPAPADGELLVRVHATSVNPFDVAVRAGYVAGYFQHKLPLILGTDFAGVVEEVGAGVSGFAKGDEVYGRAGVTRDGSYAEYVVVAATEAAPKPRTLDFAQAAALPHVVLTAWQALVEVAAISKGQTVLIHGAAGGVGHVALQLARSRGAKVAGTASINIDLLRELGVEQAIDYTKTRFEDVVRDADVVLDTVGGETQERSWSVLRPGGILISTIQPPSAEKAAAHGVRQAFIASAPPAGVVLGKIAGMIDSGTLRPAVSRTMSLSEVRQAHEIIESRHTRGKIVLGVGPGA